MNHMKKAVLLIMAFTLLFVSACSSKTTDTETEALTEAESSSQQNESSEESSSDNVESTVLQSQDILAILSPYVESSVLTQDEADKLAEFLGNYEMDMGAIGDNQGEPPEGSQGDGQGDEAPEKPEGEAQEKPEGDGQGGPSEGQGPQGDGQGEPPEGQGPQGDGQGEPTEGQGMPEDGNMNGGGIMNPLQAAVEEGIITQEQAEQLQDILKELMN